MTSLVPSCTSGKNELDSTSGLGTVSATFSEWVTECKDGGWKGGRGG